MSLDSLESAVASLLEAFDPALLSLSDAVAATAALSRVKRRIAAAELACGARCVSAGVHLQSGHPSGAAWFSTVSGESLGAARAGLETAARLVEQPEVAAAFSSGSTSLEQTTHIARAVDADPTVGRALLEAAAKTSNIGLKRACSKVVPVARSSKDEIARHERLRETTFFRSHADGDGMLQGSFRLLPEDGAVLLSRLAPFMTDSYRAAKQAGSNDSHGVRQADGFVGLVRSSGKDYKAPRAELIVVADYEALKRGHVEHGESCEIEGLGPVPITLAKQLAGDAYLSQIVERDGKPAIVKGKGRYIPPKLRTTVKRRDRNTCVVPGCGSTFCIDLDHVLPRADGGPTVLGNLACLCRQHHRMKTFGGWVLSHNGDHWSWKRPVSAMATSA